MRNITKKFINILIVHKDGLNKKWWHRLINVLIYGSTIICILAAIGILVTNAYPNWKKYNYTYSFKSDYKTSEGQEVDCIFSSIGRIFSTHIYCGGDFIDSTDFLSSYLHKETYTLEELEQMTNTLKANEALNDLNDKGKLNNIKAKRITTIFYTTIIKDIGLAALFVLGWFIFFESILYRVLIYIIYGRDRL